MELRSTDCKAEPFTTTPLCREARYVHVRRAKQECFWVKDMSLKGASSILHTATFLMLTQKSKVFTHKKNLKICGYSFYIPFGPALIYNKASIYHIKKANSDYQARINEALLTKRHIPTANKKCYASEASFLQFMSQFFATSVLTSSYLLTLLQYHILHWTFSAIVSRFPLLSYCNLNLSFTIFTSYLYLMFMYFTVGYVLTAFANIISPYWNYNCIIWKYFLASPQ